MNSEKEKVALVTGASGGIGRATVLAFAERGYKVIGIGRRKATADFPEVGLYIQADLSKAKSIGRIFEQVSVFTDHLDVLVNNAAYQVTKPLLETSLEEWDAVMATNLRAAFLMAQQAHPLLKACGGAIVNVASVHAVATSANIAAYAASKGGLLALTRAMAIEFAPDEIRVNAVLPGAVDTPMLRAGMTRGREGELPEEAQMAALAAKTVNGRIGQPDEIASAICFLADNTQSGFMTGQSIIVDGGATCRLSTE